jgi:hypothetical protein
LACAAIGLGAASARVQAQAVSPGYGGVAFEELSANPPVGQRIQDAKDKLVLLQGRGIGVALHWKSDNLNDPARWSFVTEAVRLGIQVYPWLTLPEGTEADEVPGSPNHAKTGYFPNSTNYAEWIARAKQLMTLWQQRGLAPTGMVVDMEMRKRRLHKFAELTNSGDVFGAIALLDAGINRPQYASALSAFKDYVNYAHARGWKATISTLLPILDDYADNDDGLRQAFTIPIDNDPLSASSTKWDSVSFQVMRTLYRESYPGLTPYFVFYYSREVLMRFGALGGVGLGLTHGGISDTAPLYANGNELREDVEAALQAGMPAANIGVYSFLGFWQPSAHLPSSQWLQAPRSQPWWWPLADTDTWTVQFNQTALDDFF